MKSKIGILLMTTGVVLIVSALLLLFYNFKEDDAAGSSAEIAVENLLEEIPSSPLENPETDAEAAEEIEIDGYRYIGVLTIPALHLELPILSGWNYEYLKIAPCRYYGSAQTDDLVIAAHNYRSHFGRLSQLNAGDAVFFKDANGVVHRYAVVSKEIIQPTDVETMLNKENDLTLFTCTYRGSSRMTVRCERVR